MGKGLGYFTNYPMHVFLILANEFCERFSYYGMKAVLIIFLWKALEFGPSTATALYHAFVVICYATPILGAIISDGWLGKYKTILYVSMIYGLGNIIMTVTSVPYNGSYVRWAPFIGLFIIALGTGGIKPCVSSFGGDQFGPSQQRQKDSFFSLFYLTINVGSLISTIIIPMIRGNVYCFGDSCYALCFGIPAILMLTSIVMFAIGTKWYTRVPPGESIIQRMAGCIWTAIKRKPCCCSKSKQEKPEHWLNYAAPDYDQSFIDDVKDVLRVAWLFLPLPVFWALFDQQGSRWTLQAQQMNGDFGGFVMFPDMIQFLNPLLVVIVVPLLESVVYPCLDKCKIPNRPLQRMTVGMILAGTAFLVAGFLQIAINSDAPAAIEAGNTKVQFVNTARCSVNVYHDEFISTGKTVEPLTSTDYIYMDANDKNFTFTWNSCNNGTGHNTTEQYTISEKTAYQIFLTNSFKGVQVRQDKVTLTDKGESEARVFNGLDYAAQVYLQANQKQENEPRDFGMIEPYIASGYEKLIFAEFDVSYSTNENGTGKVDIPDKVKSRNGPVYCLILSNNSGEVRMTQLTEIDAWTVNIFLQVPQYVLITFGECLFSVTGLGFAYTQAPVSMKAILTAIWLLTVCVGNIIVIIVAEASGSLSQVGEFFLFAGLMYVVTVLFACMGYFYKYVTPRDAEVDDIAVKHDDDGGHYNKAFNEYEEIGPEKVQPFSNSESKSEKQNDETTVPSGKDRTTANGTAKKAHPQENVGDDGTYTCL